MSAFTRPALNRPVFICLPNNIKGNVGARGRAGGSGRVGERAPGLIFCGVTWSHSQGLKGSAILTPDTCL